MILINFNIIMSARNYSGLRYLRYFRQGANFLTLNTCECQILSVPLCYIVVYITPYPP